MMVDSTCFFVVGKNLFHSCVKGLAFLWGGTLRELIVLAACCRLGSGVDESRLIYERGKPGI